MVEIFMPKAGFDMKEGRLIRWLKNVGDPVELDEPIMEIETDKVTMEAEAPASGILLAKLVEEETWVPVLQTVGYIGQPGEQIPETAKSEAAAPAAKSDAPVAEPAAETVAAAPVCTDGVVLATPYAKKLAKEAGIDLTSIAAGQILRGKDVEEAIAARKQIAATPLAKKYAEANGVDLAAVAGSGVNGKIRKDDVLGAMQSAAPARPADASRAPVHIPHTPIRKAIAKNMLTSLQNLAQTTISTDVDVTELMRLRERLVAHADKLGTKITVNDLLSYAAVKAAKAHPLANASYQENEIITYPYVNLSVAVATNYGLTSPVIHDADLMSLADLSRALREIVTKARDRKLTMEDQREPTMTLTNMGIYPVDTFTPILPAPQSCIIGFGCCAEKPAVYQGQLCVRTMMTLSITYDHRALDGSDGGAIMKTLKEYLETPELFLAV